MYENIEELAKNAGKMMLEASGRNYAVDEKTSSSDIVTEYDVKIQNYLTTELLKIFPDASFLGEEGEHSENIRDILKGTAFIIDPIDGTTNFVRDFYKSAVSIALAIDGEVIYGCCYVPYSDELFTAYKGKGAFRNGKAIKCSDSDITHSIASVGTVPYYKKELGDATFGIMRVLYDNAMDVRRFGSAVIDLLDVACGKANIFCEMRLSPWDHAAAGFIASEAGAVITDMNGGKLGYDGKYSVVCAARKCYDFFMNSPEIQRFSNYF